MELLVFVLLISLLFIHEMDAIRHREWRMFVGLKGLRDETAYRIFLLVHLPLYVAALFILASGAGLARTILHYALDAFLVAHTVVHFGFRKHPNNGFTSVLSRVIICAMGILALIHLFLLLSA